jgi:hypothetical protein
LLKVTDNIKNSESFASTIEKITEKDLIRNLSVKDIPENLFNSLNTTKTIKEEKLKTLDSVLNNLNNKSLNHKRAHPMTVDSTTLESNKIKIEEFQSFDNFKTNQCTKNSVVNEINPDPLKSTFNYFYDKPHQLETECEDSLTQLHHLANLEKIIFELKEKYYHLSTVKNAIKISIKRFRSWPSL